MKRFRLRKRTGTLIAIVLVLIDRYTKYRADLDLPFHEPVAVMPFLSWFLTYNEGIAFSFLRNMGDLPLIALTVAILLLVISLWKKAGRYRWLSHAGYAFITGGAIGNLFDRIFLGHVVDFILVHTQTWSFAIFNLADAFITIGAAAVVLDELLELRRAKTDTIKE